MAANAGDGTRRVSTRASSSRGGAGALSEENLAKRARTSTTADGESEPDILEDDAAASNAGDGTRRVSTRASSARGAGALSEENLAKKQWPEAPSTTDDGESQRMKTISDALIKNNYEYDGNHDQNKTVETMIELQAIVPKPTNDLDNEPVPALEPQLKVIFDGQEMTRERADLLIAGSNPSDSDDGKPGGDTGPDHKGSGGASRSLPMSAHQQEAVSTQELQNAQENTATGSDPAVVDGGNTNSGENTALEPDQRGGNN